MPTLAERLAADLVAAMHAKDAVTLGVLRLAKSAITNWELAKSKTATDEDLVDLLTTQVKQRRDAAAQYHAANRPELAAHEEEEIAILQKYLPEQLGEDAVRTLVAEAMTATGAQTAKDKGKVMGALMPKVKGKADGALVNRIVQEALGA